MGKLEDDGEPWPEVRFDSKKRKGPTDDQVLCEIAHRIKVHGRCLVGEVPLDDAPRDAALARLAADELVIWKAGADRVSITDAGQRRVDEIHAAERAAAYGAIEAVADRMLEVTKLLLLDSNGHVDLVLDSGLASEARRLFDNAATAHVMRHALILRWAALDRQTHRVLSVRWMDSMSGLRIYLDYDNIVGEARANRHADFEPLKGYSSVGPK